MDLWDTMDEAYSLRFLISNYRELKKRDRTSLVWLGILWLAHPGGWNYSNRIYTYQWFQSSGDSKIRDKVPVDPINAIFVLPRLRSILEDLDEQFPQMHRTLQQAVVACALERYWLANKDYPEELKALVPNWLPAIPLAVNSTTPLLGYRKASNGRYLLYPSDMIKPSETHPIPGIERFSTGMKYRDFVWRYPTNVGSKSESKFER
jgi:hypothetical protein